MKFQKHIKENSFPNFELLHDILCLESDICEGVSQETFDAVKRAGAKLGFRIKKSDTIFDYFKGMGRAIQDLTRTAALYLLTDVKDKKSRRILTRDAKKIIKRADKKEITGFLMQLDRASIGLTAHLRHILMSVFGIEVATWNRWLEDSDYIKKELHHVRQILRKKGMPEKDILQLKDLEAKLVRGIKNQEVIDAINKTASLKEDETKKIHN